MAGNPGTFVVFEGIEGSGKTTQAKRLSEVLQANGVKVHLTKEPWPSMVEHMIREQLANKSDQMDNRTLQLLMVANRSEHALKDILPMLQQGHTVICDRWTFSTIAYGTAFTPKELRVDMEWYTELNRPFPVPDAVFFIKVSPEEGLRRVAARKGIPERFDDIEAQKKLDAAYLQLAGKYKAIWHTVPGEGSVDEVMSRVLAEWTATFAKGKPLAADSRSVK